MTAVGMNILLHNFLAFYLLVQMFNSRSVGVFYKIDFAELNTGLMVREKLR